MLSYYQGLIYQSPTWTNLDGFFLTNSSFPFVIAKKLTTYAAGLVPLVYVSKNWYLESKYLVKASQLFPLLNRY